MRASARAPDGPARTGCGTGVRDGSKSQRRSTSASPGRSGDRARSRGLIELRRPAPLDPSCHGRDQFDCGVAWLNEWLCRYAGQSRRSNTAATWVIAERDDRIVAYASLSMTGIDLAAPPDARARGATNPVPALLIGRLAVDLAWMGLGVGSALVGHARATALELNDGAACKAVVVVALDEDARSRWERLGFDCVDPGDPTCLDRFLRRAPARPFRTGIASVTLVSAECVSRPEDDQGRGTPHGGRDGPTGAPGQ